MCQSLNSVMMHILVVGVERRAASGRWCQNSMVLAAEVPLIEVHCGHSGTALHITARRIVGWDLERCQRLVLVMHERWRRQGRCRRRRRRRDRLMMEHGCVIGAEALVESETLLRVTVVKRLRVRAAGGHKERRIVEGVSRNVVRRRAGRCAQTHRVVYCCHFGRR